MIAAFDIGPPFLTPSACVLAMLALSYCENQGDSADGTLVASRCPGPWSRTEPSGSTTSATVPGGAVTVSRRDDPSVCQADSMRP